MRRMTRILMVDQRGRGANVDWIHQSIAGPVGPGIIWERTVSIKKNRPQG